MQKKLTYLIVSILLSASCFLLFTSCGGNPAEEPAPTDKEKPVVTSISPTMGPANTEVTIEGENFGTSRANLMVMFGDKPSSIISVSDTELKVAAPAGDPEREVVVRVITAGGRSGEDIKFLYDGGSTPIISYLNRSTGFYTSTIVISGKYFSAKKENNTVKFGETEATITEATATALTVVVPDLSVASPNITVTTYGLTSAPYSFAYDLDQSAIVKTEWTVNYTVKPGVVWKSGEIDVFGGSRRINIIDITLDSSNKLGIYFNSSLAATTTLCTSADAVAGINAGYFPMSGASNKSPYIRIDGVAVQWGHIDVSPIFTNACLTIHDNVAKIRKLTNSGKNLNLEAAAIPVAEAENIIVCGPMLIREREMETLDQASNHNTSKTARSGIGVTQDGKRVFLVTMDTGNGSTGSTTTHMAKVLGALGSYSAMNLDGGGSTTMFVKDQGTNGLVNVPSGSRQRSVASVIYVK